MPTPKCPNRKTLEQFLLGKLPSERAKPLEEHLLDCDNCSQVAQAIDATGEITDAIFSEDIDNGNDEIVTKAIERAYMLRSQANTVQTDETLPHESAEEQRATDNTLPQEFVDFLHPPETSDEIGRLGGYRVLELMGVGGMGVVFRAEDSKLRRQIALKVMKPAIAASRSAKERFLREAQSTAAIDHHHIVHIYEVGEDRGIPFIAMQFLRGESLERR